MKDFLSAQGRRLSLLSLAVFCFVMAALPAAASAAVDADKLTEPIEDEVTANTPKILLFIGTIFAITFIIGWLVKRARTAGK
ncbi:MAG TPA: hypothetical protein VFM94_03595 [Solirubrobacterales bacterium]|nr:hypothetical protein [Solirubrobacterales bacterium]